MNSAPFRRTSTALPASSSSPRGGSGGLEDDPSSSAVGGGANIQVVVRVRPPVARELQSPFRAYVEVVQFPRDASNALTLCDAFEGDAADGGAGAEAAPPVVYARQTYYFDAVLRPSATQAELYQRCARPVVLSVLDGYNATVLAYGQTGSGKTYTMEGFTSEAERGIIPRAVEDIFAAIGAGTGDAEGAEYRVQASYMQIYNEVISDLLQDPPPPHGSGGGGARAAGLAVRFTPQGGARVEGLSQWRVRGPRDVYALIERGTALRATSTTRMSELSSRSHAVFALVVEASACGGAYTHTGKLNIVDLAGSEKVRQTGVSGQRLEETKNINKSLHELGNVIAALSAQSAGHKRHVPFRNSVLTSVLRDSLGGNCRTMLIACISPALESYTESLSTLLFATRAKSVRTHATVNQLVDPRAQLAAYEREIQRLRGLLQQSGVGAEVLAPAEGGGGGGDLVVQRYEQRIRELESIIAATADDGDDKNAGADDSGTDDEGGGGGSPREARRRERRAMEAEERAQVLRYKQLLLKQRDIMLHLTTRLNERDETILRLQEEIDAYDAHVQFLEDQAAAAAGQTASAPAVVAGEGAGTVSEAEARAYVRRVKDTRAAEAGGGGGGGGAACYRSDLRPAGPLLTADEKIVELLMLRGGAGAPLLALSEKETRRLEVALRTRAAEIAGAQLRAAREEGAARAELAELHGRAAAAALELLSAHLSRRRAASEAELAAEVDKGRRAMEALAGELLAERRREREAAARALREVERVKFEMEQVMEVVRYSPAQRAEASRVWQTVQSLEERVARAGLPDTPAADGSDGAGGPAAALSAEAARWRERMESVIRAAQDATALVRAETRRQEEEGGGGTEASAPAVPEAIRRELESHRRDRKALLTILNQRMRPKAESVCAILAERGGAAAAPGEELRLSAAEAARITQDVKSLHKLLVASARALEAEEASEVSS